MLRSGLLVLFLLTALCAPGQPVGSAIPLATRLRDAGDFAGAAGVLGNALDDPNLPAEERLAAGLQLDILNRIKLDYSLTREQLFTKLLASVKDSTLAELTGWVKQGWFDGRMIDGEMRYTGTSVSNLYFRHPELRARRQDGKDDSSEQKGRLATARAITAAAKEQHTPYVLPHYYLCTMNVKLESQAAQPGQLLRAWLPIPRAFPYQDQFAFITSSVPPVSIAPETSPIRSVCLEETCADSGPADFSITYRYRFSGVHFSIDPARVTAPDFRDAELSRFTNEGPHVVFSRPILQAAAEAAAGLTNPAQVARAFYDWIDTNVNYSFAREYSTLDDLAQYCVTNRYGDCGQEAMLFITLCRSRGIPARWQTGWDLWPGFHDIHDWTEIYLAPYGWVPVDPWAGLYAEQGCTLLSPAERAELHDFYFGGLDYYRMAANADHSQQLDPPKLGHRSDNVDFQRAEIDCDGRNVYFDKFTYHMKVGEFGCPPFTSADVLEPERIAAKLLRHSDAAKSILWDRLTDADQAVVWSAAAAKPALPSTRDMLATALNRVIAVDAPPLYDPERFEGVPLRPETIKLLQTHPQGIDLSRANRLLLEDVFYESLARLDEPK